jgi:tetratricopeptide (TPR) repeat protein
MKSYKSYFDQECASAYYFRGDTKADLKQQVEAIKDYDKAIELDPKREWAYWSRGIAKSALGQFFEAIRDFDKAIELDSKVATFYESRAIVKDALGQKTAGNADRAMVKKLNAN